MCKWLQPTRLLCPRDSPGKNTGEGCHFLLQGLFPTQGLNPGLLTAGRFFTVLATQEVPLDSRFLPLYTTCWIANQGGERKGMPLIDRKRKKVDITPPTPGKVGKEKEKHWYETRSVQVPLFLLWGCVLTWTCRRGMESALSTRASCPGMDRKDAGLQEDASSSLSRMAQGCHCSFCKEGAGWTPPSSFLCGAGEGWKGSYRLTGFQKGC